MAFSRKSIFKIFRKTAAIFSILKILIFFSNHSTELKIPHHMKVKPTEYVYLVKNCIILENILAVQQLTIPEKKNFNVPVVLNVHMNEIYKK